MLFHPEKKAEKWMDAAELIHLCYYEYDGDDCGPTLMKSVQLLRREGLRQFWFSAALGGEIEELLHVPAVDAYFLYGPDCGVHLTGVLDQREYLPNTECCQVRFVARKGWLMTGFNQKKLPISSNL